MRRGSKGKGRRRCPALLILALAAALGLVLSACGQQQARTGAITSPKYPQMAPYPDEGSGEDDYDRWAESREAQRRDLGDISPLTEFFKKSTGVFLADTQGENRNFSPLNVYMALSMLAEITGGESREQVLNLLGSGSIEELRKQAKDIWNANYCDDGANTSILASSLWLSDDINFKKKTMDSLAENYYASSYQGEMGSEEFNELLRGWLNEQTGGLLKEQAGLISMDPDTVLALASTIYFKAKWAEDFNENMTSPQTFHTPAGDTEKDFMHAEGSDTYFWGEKFSAVTQGFLEGGEMKLVLPNEGITPEELISDPETLDFLFSAEEDWANQQYLTVKRAIPKFDVVSQFDLTEGLNAMGVTDVFDPEVSDFSPMADTASGPLALSSANHAARVQIDEKGCTAAALTVMLVTGAAMPPEEEVEFVLDRPFIFCVTGEAGLPLFVGIVNNP